MSERSFRVAVVGATGLVGREILSVLDEREFPVSDVLLYAKDDAAGVDFELGGRTRTVAKLPETMPEVDVAFLCGGTEVNERLGAAFVAKGALVVDLDGGPAAAPLVLGPADVSGSDVHEPLYLAHPAARLLVAPLRALGQASAIRRIVATLVVPASSFGVEAVENLGAQTISLLNASRADVSDEESVEEDDEEAVESVDDPSSLAFRCAPLAAEDAWLAKVRAQTERLLGADTSVAIHAARVPIFYGQAASIAVELAAPVAVEELGKRLREAPSVILVEGDASGRSTFDTLGIDAVQVSGLGTDPSAPQWIRFWAMAENVRQGAALPAVVLAESLLLRH